MIALIDGLLPQTSPVFLYVYAPFFILTIPATERTEVLYGTENVVNEELQFFSKAQTKVLVKETLQYLIKQLDQIVE